MSKCIECKKEEAEDRAPREFWQHLYCHHCWDWLGQCEPYDNLKPKREIKKKVKSGLVEIYEIHLSKDMLRNHNLIDR